MSAMSREYWKERNARRMQDPAYVARKREMDRRRYIELRDDPAFKASRAAIMRSYAKLDDVKAKMKARRKVRTELEAGRMHRMPCEKCGSTSRVNAHHDDYSSPLSVRWLCHEHHLEHHRAAAQIGLQGG